MKMVKTLLVAALMTTLSFSQAINIKGTVTNDDGVALEGAIVQLVEQGYKDTTDSDGNFTITDNMTGVYHFQNQVLQNKLSAYIKNNILYIDPKEKSNLEINTFNMQGKKVSSIIKNVNLGKQTIKLPKIVAGEYIHKIRTSLGELILKSNSLGNGSRGSLSDNNQPLMKTAKRTEKYPEDSYVLKTIKKDYLDDHMMVTLDTAGVEIKLALSAGDLVDIDGNVYQTVKIGDQVWTTSNFRSTQYTDGTPIPYITDNTEWGNLTTPGFCYYDNDTLVNRVKYGGLYNWYAFMSGKLAPEGWHVPSSEEWFQLNNYLIANGYNYDGSTEGNFIGKAMAAKIDWGPKTNVGVVAMEPEKNNSSHFSGMPSGMRGADGRSSFLTVYADWWSTKVDENSPEYVYYHLLQNDRRGLERFMQPKNFGMAVRLVKD